ESSVRELEVFSRLATPVSAAPAGPFRLQSVGVRPRFGCCSRASVMSGVAAADDGNRAIRWRQSQAWEEVEVEREGLWVRAEHSAETPVSIAAPCPDQYSANHVLPARSGFAAHLEAQPLLVAAIGEEAPRPVPDFRRRWFENSRSVGFVADRQADIF